MAKSKSTRAVGRKPTLADRIDSIRRDLIGVRASVLTTYALLHCREGIDKEVATNLMRAAILPVESALAEIETLKNRGAS
jgi:hypothetical protein